MLGFLAVLSVAQAQVQAVPVRYRFESRDTSVIDLAAYGQPDVRQVVLTSALLSVTVRDSAGAQVADIVIDSISRQDGGAMQASAAYLPGEMTESGRGVVFHVLLVNGRVREYHLSKPANLEASTVSTAIAMIFPNRPPTAKVGDQWVDTTRTGGSPGGRTSSTEVNTWKLAAADTLEATLAATSKTETGTDLGAMTRTGTGNRRIVLDPQRAVRSATLSIANTGAMGDAKVRGTMVATVTRLP